MWVILTFMTATIAPTRQEQQQEALRAAEDAPGVREVLEVYAPIAAFSGTRVVQPQSGVVYATGGNP